MTIYVPPIPKLTSFEAPSFTLGTSNVAGDSKIAVSSNSTLLVYDTTLPAAVGAASSVGSAVTATRRDHVHQALSTQTTIIASGRTASAGAGDQALTGVGFSPTGLIALATVASTSIASWGFGDDAVAEDSSTMLSNQDFAAQAGYFMYASDNAGRYLVAVIKTLDADGCTLTWSKGGAGYDILYRILFLR